jgi:hypothetical protein
LLDRRGLEQEDCSDAWESDASVSGPCCLPGAYWSDPSEAAACYAGGGGGSDGSGGTGDAFVDDATGQRGNVESILKNNPDCLNLIAANSKYTNPTSAIARLDASEIMFGNLGTMSVISQPLAPNGVVFSGGNPAANNGAVIELNNNYFPDPDQHSLDVLGTPKSMTAAFNQVYGSNLTGVQIEQVLILHELVHVFQAGNGKDSQIDTISANITLIKTCIK